MSSIMPAMSASEKESHIESGATIADPSSPRKRPRLTPPHASSGHVPIQTQDERETDRQRQRELLAGLTEYVSGVSECGFTGIYKARYTDFLVNEIGLDGEVLHLERILRPRRVDAELDDQARLREDAPTNPQEQNNDVCSGHGVPISTTAIAADTQSPDSTATDREDDNIRVDEVMTKAQDVMIPESKAGGMSLTVEDRDRLLSYLSAEDLTTITHLLDGTADKKTLVRTQIVAREKRKDIHQDIRTLFNSQLDSYTDKSGQIVIQVMKGSDNPWKHAGCSAHPSNERGRGGAQRQRGGAAASKVKRPDLPFLHFTLLKENRDTMESISFLSRQLKVKARAFQFAGTKDRRAVTVQRVSVQWVSVARMAAAGRSLRSASIGDFEGQSSGLHLGDLCGNEFVITLRDCHFGDIETLGEAEEVVTKAFKSLHQRGFINYFGMQRFGSFSTTTDITGMHMLKGDFAEAIGTILHYSPACLEPPTNDADAISRDDRARAEAIRLWVETGDSNAALRILPARFNAETSIIRHLGHGTQRGDFQGALSAIPRNHRLMFVHAYQSMIWNHAASERWRLFGAKVVEGDLVMVERPPALEESVAENEEHDFSDMRLPQFPRARTLTAEEANSGKWSIFDVVLATPGFDVNYPANAVGDFYTKFMGSERGGGLDPHSMRRSWKDVSLSGSYRTLMARPLKEITASVHSYSEMTEQLARTDLDRIQEQKVQHSRVSKMEQMNVEAREHVISQPEDKLDSGEQKVAVILTMQLGTSQYATVALRELMRDGLRAWKSDFTAGRS